jgi:hypothetical protein
MRPSYSRAAGGALHIERKSVVAHVTDDSRALAEVRSKLCALRKSTMTSGSRRYAWDKDNDAYCNALCAVHREFLYMVQGDGCVAATIGPGRGMIW